MPSTQQAILRHALIRATCHKSLGHNRKINTQPIENKATHVDGKARSSYPIASVDFCADAQNAPVCKFILGSTVGSSILLDLPLKQYQPYFIYTHTNIFDKGQLWRVLTSKLAFMDLKDLFVCSVLIYYFRVFEKRFGSRKFCSQLLGSAILSTLLELLAVYICRIWDIPLGPLPTGPLCLIYPLFVPYYYDIPRVPLSHIWGIPMTGKSISYILGLQAASSSPESILTALCGLLAGVIWRVNFLKIQKLIQVPEIVARLCNATLGRLLNTGDHVVQDTTHIGATPELQRQEAMERLEQQVIWRSLQAQRNNIGEPQVQNLVNGPGIFGAGNNNAAQGLRQRLNAGIAENPPEVSEDQVQQLVEMGFNQEQVRQALQVSNNDISMATNILLQQS